MVKFYRGNRNKYDITTHRDAIYFASDTGEIIMNNRVYGASSELANTVETLNTLVTGSESVQGSVDARINQAITNIISDAPDALNTLAEIAQWILDDTTASAQIIQQIAAIKQYINKSGVAFIDTQLTVEVENSTAPADVTSINYDPTKKIIVALCNNVYYKQWSNDNIIYAYDNYYGQNGLLKDKVYVVKSSTGTRAYIPNSAHTELIPVLTESDVIAITNQLINDIVSWSEES